MKLLFDCQKSAYNDFFIPETIEKVFDFSGAPLTDIRSQDDKEGEKSQNCEIDQGSPNYENKHVDEDLNLDSQTNSTSEEEFDVGNEKITPVTASFESKNISGDEKHSNVAQSDLHTNPGNAPKKFEENVFQAHSEPTGKHNADHFVISDEQSYSGQRNKDNSDQKPEREIFKDIGGIDDVFPQVKKGKQGKGIHERVKYSSAEEKRKSERLFEEKVGLKPRHFIQFSNACPSLPKSEREKELEEENRFLTEQLESLQIKHEEILAELGKIAVEKTAKENKERKSVLFQQIYHSPTREVKISSLSNSCDKPTDGRSGPFRYQNGRQNGYHESSYANATGPANSSPRPQTTNKSANPPPLNASVIYLTDSNEQPVRGAEGLVQGSNKGEKVTNDIDEREFQTGNLECNRASTFKINRENITSTTQNSPCVQSRQIASCREGANKSEKANETNDLASISRPGYENLSFSVQQDDSGSESISLSNVPPTSVATTLYNNYKLLLLYLAQSLLSSDVVKLKDWAAQNFSINNQQNATNVLFQLDQKGIINASDLSQLSDFFESIIRFDFVHIIDGFLLGDYSLLRQNQASRSKNHGANPAQNLGHRVRNQDFLNAVNTLQLSTSSTRNPTASRRPESNNGSQISHPQYTQQAAFRNSSGTTNPTHLPRAPDENQTMASGQPNIKPATNLFSPSRMTDAAVADNGLVTSKCICFIFLRYEFLEISIYPSHNGFYSKYRDHLLYELCYDLTENVQASKHKIFTSGKCK